MRWWGMGRRGSSAREEERSVGEGVESEAVVDKRAAKRARGLY